MQDVPFPVEPELHEQLNDPAVFVQVALAAHLCARPVHSSSSGERAGEVEQMFMSKRRNFRRVKDLLELTRILIL